MTSQTVLALSVLAGKVDVLPKKDPVSVLATAADDNSTVGNLSVVSGNATAAADVAIVAADIAAAQAIFTGDVVVAINTANITTRNQLHAALDAVKVWSQSSGRFSG